MHAKSWPTSCSVERRGGFVEDDDPGVEQQRAGDLDELLVRGVDVPTSVSGRRRTPRRSSCRRGTPPHEPGLPEARRAQLASEEQVLRDVEVVDQVQFLVDERHLGTRTRGRG